MRKLLLYDILYVGKEVITKVAKILRERSDKEIKLIHVEMFKNRHLTPDYVDKYYFANNEIQAMDSSAFKVKAYEKTARWKAEGATGIVLYRSGLMTAYDEIINACCELGLYLCPMTFSFAQGIWLPSYLKLFDGFGVPNTPSSSEKCLWAKEFSYTAQFKTLVRYREYVRYVKVYSDILLRLDEEREKRAQYVHNPEYELTRTEREELIDRVIKASIQKHPQHNKAVFNWIKDCIMMHIDDFYTNFRTLWLLDRFKQQSEPLDVRKELKKLDTKGSNDDTYH